jgi:TniQ
MLERLQQVLEEDLVWMHSSYAPALHWEAQLTQGAVWDQGASNGQMMAFLHTFFVMAKDYFQRHRHPRQSDGSTGKHIVPTPLAVASQLRPPTVEELVIPRPWEDLPSIIGRVARAMHVGHPDWLLISTDTPHRKVYSREIPLLHRLADYRLFEGVLGLDEAEIYSMTLHRFATRLQPPEKGGHTAPSSSGSEIIARPLLSRSTARRIGISTRHTKLCLDCLEEEPGYDRLFWRLRPVILCPRHSLLLIDRYPSCLAPIPGLRPFPEKCPYCHHDYRQAPRVRIAPTSWLHTGQAMLLHLLTAQNVGDWTDVPTLAQSPLLRTEPWHYFALLERCKNLLQPTLTSSIVVQTLKKLAWEDDQSIGESPATREVAMQMALFHYLLASWPENLLAMIERVAKQTKGQQVGGSMLANFWQKDQLVQHLWSSPPYGETPFVFLLQVFEALFTWATTSVIRSSRGEGGSCE